MSIATIAAAILSTALAMLEQRVCSSPDASDVYTSALACASPHWEVCSPGQSYPGSRMQVCCATGDPGDCRLIGSADECIPLAEVNTCDRPWWRDSVACQGPGGVYLGDPFCVDGDVQLCAEGEIGARATTAVCCELDCEGEVLPEQCELDPVCNDHELHACSF